MFPALLAGLIVTLLCGLINGLLVAVIGILPFLVTLGMMSVARGIATVLTTGQYISFPNAPAWFTRFGRYEIQIPNGGGFYGLPVTLIIGIALAVITSLLFSYWAPLRSFFFVGESPEAARLSGIKVTRLTIAAYLLSALFVWFTAVLLTSANKIGYANYGVGAEMRALAAAVVGGASLAGGAGNIFGTFLGVLMLALIGNGFVMLNGNPNWQQASVGNCLDCGGRHRRVANLSRSEVTDAQGDSRFEEFLLQQGARIGRTSTSKGRSARTCRRKWGGQVHPHQYHRRHSPA